MQLDGCSRVQEISHHSEATQKYIALVDHRDISRSDLHLGSDSFDNTSSFPSEDQAAGLGAQLSVGTIVVVDTGLCARSIFRSRGDEGAEVTGGGLAGSTAMLGTILARNGMFMDL